MSLGNAGAPPVVGGGPPQGFGVTPPASKAPTFSAIQAAAAIYPDDETKMLESAERLTKWILEGTGG